MENCNTPSKTLEENVDLINLFISLQAGFRSVAIEIYNKTKSKSFTQPQIYCESGKLCIPPVPCLSPGEQEVCLFTKKTGTACGSVGVISYKFGGSRIALLFSNPFDYNIYDMKIGLLVDDQNSKTNYEQYRQMYYKEKTSCRFVKAVCGKEIPTLSLNSDGVKISANMSTCRNAILKLVFEDEY
ncbi:DELTA-actitoxin-Afr1e-like [Erpetoichthys calabaricus]|uniref:DELTA-actitoxin-Afr1e-like n=1 Tax=Erpetoichthys calabaricus TaxID=27687 RepID=UPI002234C412|nr:DELTA-actitoxin-Afr1e-like [Erpetoichthys calabaricus]